MRIRIHELAKRYNMEGKDLLALLKERGYVTADTKSVSSTVSNIYAEEIEKELGSRVTPSSASAAEAAPTPAAVAEPTVTAGAAPESATVRIPSNVRVKTAADIAREREVVAAA